MQGTYIPQYTQVPAANISVEVVSPVFSHPDAVYHLNPSCETILFVNYCSPPRSQESAVQQPVAIETPTEHTTYSYQHNK